MKNLVIISLIIFLCVSCTREQTVTQQELLEKILAEKMADYLHEKHRDCIDNAHLEAEIYVDSFISKMDQYSVLEDSIEMIQKPSKPDRPEYIKINDPGPIVPFEIKQK